MRFILLLSLMVVGLVFTSNAQSKKKNKQKNKTENVNRSNSFEPFSAEKMQETNKKVSKRRKKTKTKSFRSLFNKRMEDKKQEFYNRLEANAKRDKKIARKMKKPQYSDPMYFGHKKKPKKRKRGKRKFCKECGIVH